MSDRPGLPFARLAAEFAVIVIGVLVALLAESAWQERGERVQEREVLERISEDLVTDSSGLASDRAWTGFALAAAEDARHVLAERDTLAPPARLAVLYAAATVRMPIRFTRTWDDLTASGRVSIVSDPDLRRALIDFYGRVEEIRQAQADLTSEYRAAVVATLPTRFTRRILGSCIRAEDSLGSEARPDVNAAIRGCAVEPDEDANALLRRVREIDGIERALGARTYAIVSIEEFVESAESSFANLRSQLDAELERGR